jgi:hypothetical protein
MARRGRIKYAPSLLGNVEISKDRSQIFIGGDRKGLRSLARLLNWLATFDQEKVPGMPDGERYHTHLYPKNQTGSYGSLTQFSQKTEVCRLDAKGTSELPEKYRALVKRSAKAVSNDQGRRTARRAARSMGSKRNRAKKQLSQ